MSNWGDDESWGESPSQNEEFYAGAPSNGNGSQSSDSGFVPDAAAVLIAETAVAEAQHLFNVAEDKLSAAEDALADAEDEVGVAEVKAADYEADDGKLPWQRAAATRDVAKRKRAQRRAEKAVGKAQAAVADARAALNDAAENLRAALVTPAPPESDDQPLYYGSVDEFFREYLRLAYRRPINGRARVWAADWWNYDEAVIRLEALWRSWEELRQDASTGMSVWWRDHADHHMAVLMDPDGPFAAADANNEANQSRKGDPLPYTAPPEGLFRDVRLPDEPVELNDAG
ncbi:DUF4913 domain-containing protein [Leucobacter massiliensis]|uniref:DUF4913 domain-containing protein n=1 Tax=Leucobacter massiliensis TaxID=1686285 RepID=A0A2S9QSD6_9MICO|nr:DUF4913 domain-containing protein [Leucobacter massiliensis]PRI12505.1 hypothetical protein B4915_00910 [Leucobacter massiliensis]